MKLFHKLQGFSDIGLMVLKRSKRSKSSRLLNKNIYARLTTQNNGGGDDQNACCLWFGKE